MAEQIPTFNGCSAGKYCSEQAMTPVGENKTKIYHRTVTTLIGQGPAYTGSKTETYIVKPNTLTENASWTLAATTTDGGKTQTFTDAAGADLRKSMGPGGNIAKNTQAQVQTTLSKGLGTNASGQTGDVLEKITPEQQKNAGVISPSVSTSNSSAAAAGGATADQVQQLVNQAGKYKGRHDYPQSLKYPIQMNDNQDCMKFQIIQYVPSKLGIGAQNTTLRTSSPALKNILATITLPMPSGGISDRNSVDWGSSELNPVQAAFADTAMAMIAGGGEAGANAAGKNLQAATANKDVTTALIAIKASEAAVGGTGLLSRVAGLAVDSSLELLFNWPSLREFSRADFY